MITFNQPVNGSGKFRIADLSTGTVYNFSIYYQALKSTFRPEIVEHQTQGGNIFQLPLYIQRFYALDYSQLIFKGDYFKFQDIINAFMQSHEIILTPSTQIQSQSYRVFLDPGQEIALNVNYAKVGNTGFTLFLKTEGLPALDGVDPELESLDWLPTGNEIDFII